MSTWISMNKAAKELGIHSSKLSRLVHNGKLQSKKDLLDSRLTLVDIDEVRELFRKNAEIRGEVTTEDIQTNEDTPKHTEHAS